MTAFLRDHWSGKGRGRGRAPIAAPGWDTLKDAERQAELVMSGRPFRGEGTGGRRLMQFYEEAFEVMTPDGETIVVRQPASMPDVDPERDSHFMNDEREAIYWMGAYGYHWWNGKFWLIRLLVAPSRALCLCHPFLPRGEESPTLQAFQGSTVIT